VIQGKHSGPLTKDDLLTLTIWDQNKDFEFSWIKIRDIFDLTEKEAIVVSKLAMGLSVAETAEDLEISQGTLRQHLKRIFMKLGVCRQSELVKLVFSSPAFLGSNH